MTNTLQSTTPSIGAIDKKIAIALRDGLADHQDGYSLTSYDSAAELVHAAGLSSCLIPYRKSVRSREWDVVMAVIDRGIADQSGGVQVFTESDGALVVTLKTYALMTLRPMQIYVGDLTTCNLKKPWYATSLDPLERVLVPTPSRYSQAFGHGQSAAEDWAIFKEDFEALWGSGDRHVNPGFQLQVKRLRFPISQVYSTPQ